MIHILYFQTFGPSKFKHLLVLLSQTNDFHQPHTMLIQNIVLSIIFHGQGIALAHLP